MSQYHVERRLCWIYAIIIICGAISSICTAVAWNHWKWVLDLCPVKCGCILYARGGIYFEGGDASACYWVVFGPIPVILVTLVMCGYHFFRVCINNTGKYERGSSAKIEQREGEMVMVSSRAEVRNNDSISYCWIPSAVISAIFAVYCLVHAAILTDGYYKTCNQYRGELIKILRSTGNQVHIIHSRLACQGVFDFMDYLQPDVMDRRRGEVINTGLALTFAIACSWIMVILWIIATIINSVRARKDRHVRTCCGN